MDKTYNHSQEEQIYDAWEKSGAFEAPTKVEAEKKSLKPFCIIMPPPNASDPMHVGHAMFVTVEDIMIRYHRTRGEATLWLPGTDHAGIETQFVFEKKLAKEGKSRFDFDRETLYQMIWDHVQENSGVAVSQMKRLGASADWSRFKFTLDKDVVEVVLDTFIKLHKDGLIYRGERLVNYCTKCGTGYSELEVEYEERNSPMYYVRYPVVSTPSTTKRGSSPLAGGGDNDVKFVVVATVRPEPIFADTHLAVNPKDKKRRGLIGKKVANPLTGEEMEVIGDEFVDSQFGTGIVKLTPAHDANDWEVAEKYNLPRRQAINEKGRMTDLGGKYAGMKIEEARKAVVEDLREKGLLEKVDEKYVNRVATCYRCHRVIEPLPMKQFFVKVESLAKKALAALNSGETKILGAGREKILRHWLKNLKDWNISRQIVWGIRIPVWYEQGNKNEFVVSKTSPGEGWVQETDTFDTWFSSGQWPVVTLKTNRPGDFEYYYPTSVLETAYEILPFWVMRMMLLGIYLTGKSPFKYVYLHGLIRDEQGRKMSKSIGNVINPLESIEKYGADALRMALVMNSSPGVDKNASEAQIKGMRNFANKIWNSARFVQSRITNDQFSIFNQDQGPNDQIFKKHLGQVVEKVTKQLDGLQIGLAAETVYNEFWHWYCDETIEDAKAEKVSYEALYGGLVTFLKLLHPFVPFVTEAVWKELGEDGLLVETKWPSK